MSKLQSRRQQEATSPADDHNIYSDPYSYPPAASGGDYGYGTASDNDAAFRGQDQAIPGGRRQNTYPPNSNDDFGYEKGLNPVTRGSIAAQMAAEGAIPKKEGLKLWRSDEHKGAFTKGGRGRCCGRLFCCCIILAVVILVSIVSAFFLWVKPPEVSFNGIEPPGSGSEVNVISDGFQLNFRLNIGVINPNFFGAQFSSIAAQAYYPTKPDTQFGKGELKDVTIRKNSNTTIRFPFQADYTTTYDPDLTVLKDIASKCGFLTTGATSSVGDIKVNYKLKLSLKVLSLAISPSFSSSASFACPLSESDISGLLNDAGITGLDSVSSALSGSRKRSLDGATALELDRHRRALHDRFMSLVMERGLGLAPVALTI